jgi:hypothetical protein
VPVKEASGLPISAAGIKAETAAIDEIGSIGSAVQGGEPPLQKHMAMEAPGLMKRLQNRLRRPRLLHLCWKKPQRSRQSDGEAAEPDWQELLDRS